MQPRLQVWCPQKRKTILWPQAAPWPPASCPATVGHWSGKTSRKIEALLILPYMKSKLLSYWYMQLGLQLYGIYHPVGFKASTLWEHHLFFVHNSFTTQCIRGVQDRLSSIKWITLHRTILAINSDICIWLPLFLACYFVIFLAAFNSCYIGVWFDIL